MTVAATLKFRSIKEKKKKHIPQKTQQTVCLKIKPKKMEST